VAAVIVSTLLTLAYFVRLFVQVFRDAPAFPSEPRVEAPWTLRLSLGTLSGAIIALGLFSDRIVKVLLEATESLGL
jgi:NADH:ubiquinone oxidoreductase subunit 5 (subunit L)/multisubunit Na+/H+ antiporter MnhA subunit